MTGRHQANNKTVSEKSKGGHPKDKHRHKLDPNLIPPREYRKWKQAKEGLRQQHSEQQISFPLNHAALDKVRLVGAFPLWCICQQLSQENKKRKEKKTGGGAREVHDC